ncbi:hypothetical protein SH1V18_11720 [Vallitalea longa]|uniref:SbsA Ig-like domain-containing protein n=1 Tax=Vallitalea longa TaxID=2936439 RepID=A0A9W5Y8D6_9FIRM|nr:hypothetical protein [Vallitalea longa]GKX28692.1 hypothetical protein SH1V18_11720 [Vallitalea longa]
MEKLSKFSVCLLVLVLFCSTTLVYANSEDREKPELKSVIAIDTNTVEITFNEAVDKTTAEDISNYVISELAGNTELDILSAVLDETKTKVVIVTDEQCEMVYSLEIRGVTDLAGNIIDDCQMAFVGLNLDKLNLTDVRAVTNKIVRVTFNKKINKVSAENTANYVIKDKNINKDIKVINATLDSTGCAVTLTTDEMGKYIYNVELNNIVSVSGETLNDVESNFIGVTASEEFVITKVKCSSDNTVEVTFNLEIEDYNINDMTNYEINEYNSNENIQVKKASISADGKTIVLETDILSVYLYDLKIKDISSVWGQILEPVTVSFVGNFK